GTAPQPRPIAKGNHSPPDRIKKPRIPKTRVKSAWQTRVSSRRHSTVVTAGRLWLFGQGRRAGFVPDEDVAVDGYDQRRLPREEGAPLRFSSLDFDGRLTVTDPDLFLRHLALGFGRAKAFGCGLMLIRRAR
ncbi:MAG: type I-E CRISPR-associated protein Cas6/Cse3/CasE, partial [Rhodobacter sp.]|nr:type I-E CRISPR-associated protein Cas6/Cse3/CasE [Rhodobacter sp.]